jgi:hypothetical protein
MPSDANEKKDLATIIEEAHELRRESERPRRKAQELCAQIKAQLGKECSRNTNKNRTRP